MNWISVEDRLPKETQGRMQLFVEREYIGQGMPKPPICYVSIGTYETDIDYELEQHRGWVDDYDNQFNAIEEGGVTGGKVTHWQPLPAPPENDNG